MATAKEALDRNFATWNAGDRSGWLGLIDANWELLGPGGLTGTGKPAAEQFWSLWNDAFPGHRLDVVRSVAEGDTVVFGAIFVGTHSGPLSLPSGTVPATGKNVRIPYVLIATASGDRFSRFVFYYDNVEVLTQLGLMPTAVAA
jgi:predicted ester cyclase